MRERSVLFRSLCDFEKVPHVPNWRQSDSRRNGLLCVGCQFVTRDGVVVVEDHKVDATRRLVKFASRHFEEHATGRVSLFRSLDNSLCEILWCMSELFAVKAQDFGRENAELIVGVVPQDQLLAREATRNNLLTLRTVIIRKRHSG